MSLPTAIFSTLAGYSLTTRTSSNALKIWVFQQMRHKSIDLTRLLAKRYGRAIGFIYVGGYPKSGTTWLSQLTGHMLGVPYVDGYFLPLTFECVVHHHWTYHSSFDHSIQVIRDGRDVMVSLYINLMKNYMARRKLLTDLGKPSLSRVWVDNVGQRAARDRRFRDLFGEGFDPWDVERHLPIFMESDMKKPFIPAVRLPWPEYIRSWCEKAKRTVLVKYEDMLADGVTTLSTVLAEYTGEAVEQEEVELVVRKYSFRKQSGREPGQESRKSFARKGISGDWRNYFTPVAREVFDYYAGDVLIDLGYEQDHKWV